MALVPGALRLLQTRAKCWACFGLLLVGVWGVRNLAAAELSVEQQALQTLNEARVRAGAGPLEAEPTLARAAVWQAGYVAQTELVEHVRQKERGFLYVLETPAQRRMLAGYFSRGSEALGYSARRSPQAQVHSLLDAPYHRLVLLDPEIMRVGVGMVGQEHAGQTKHALAFEFGHYQGTRQDTVVIWPAKGARDVPLAFRPAEESPNIAPDAEEVGYVLTVQVGVDQVLRVETFTLTDTVTGQAVFGSLRSSANDHAMFANAVAFVPDKPLAPSARYVARFKGHTDNGIVETDWSFSTRGAMPAYQLTLLNDPPKVGEPMRFQVLRPSSKASVCVRQSPNWTSRFDWVDETHFEIIPGSCSQERCAMKVTLSEQDSCADPDSKAVVRILQESGMVAVSAYSPEAP